MATSLSTKKWKQKTNLTKKWASGLPVNSRWEELCSDYDNRCLCCGEKKKLTIDHVLPKSRGGPDEIYNYCPLCYECNQHKGNKFIDYRRGISRHEKAPLGYYLKIARAIDTFKTIQQEDWELGLPFDTSNLDEKRLQRVEREYYKIYAAQWCLYHYGVILEDADLEQIKQAIYQSKARAMAFHENLKITWRINYKYQIMFVVYDHLNDYIYTFLGKDG